MKRWTKNIGIALTTLFVFASQASWVLARAGGGVGGSTGRSFSSGGGGLGRSLSGGGFSGGGFGGFNSFFPFMFFGGSSFGGGSGGLFGLIFVGIIFYLIYKAWRTSNRWRQGGSRGYNKPQSSGTRPWRRDDVEDLPSSTPVDLSGRQISNSANLQRFGKAMSFTRENMQYYSQTFSRWDRDYLVGRVRQVFFWLQDAWSRQDLSRASDYLAPALAEKYRADLEGIKARGERNVIKNPVLNPEDLEFIHCHLDEGNEHVMVMIYANIIDYTVDSSGRQISGDNQNHLYFTEFWEFYWQKDKWVLANILQEDALELANIARGDF